MPIPGPWLVAILLALASAPSPIPPGGLVQVSKEGGFTITWPGDPTSEVIKEVTPQAEMDNHYFHVARPDAQFSVQYNDLEKFDGRMIDVQKSLDATVDSFAVQKYYRVTSRKSITLDGVPGREVEFEIKGEKIPIGNTGRARAYLSKNRFYQVIVLGTKASASPEATAFFDSFKIRANDLPSPAIPGAKAVTWDLYTSKPGRFSAILPGKPEETMQEIQTTGDEPRRFFTFRARDDATFYVVTYIDQDAAAIKTPKTLLDTTRDVLLVGAKGTLVSEKKTDLGRNPGREVKAEVPFEDDPKGGRMTCRIYLVGKRVYQVMVIGPEAKSGDGRGADTFFKSFKTIKGQ